MKEEHGNIETWLKTAAQQPGPGIDRKDEEDGWAGLSAMLDDDEAKPGIIAGGPDLRIRRRRLLTLTAVAVITSVLLLISLRHLKDISRPSSGNAQTTVATGDTNNTVRKSDGNGIVHQAAEQPSDKKPQHAEQAAGDAPGDTPAPLPEGNIKEDPVLLPQQPALPVQTQPDHGMSDGWSLQTVPLARNNGLTLPGPGQLKWPVPPRAAASALYPRWAVQAGFVAASDEGRGARTSLMYRLPVRKHFYLQPYIGAGYTANYDKPLQHLAVVSARDSTGPYRQDSVWTSYRVRNMLTADAGVRAGYTLRQFSFAAGIRYHYIVQSNGDSSSFRKPAPPPSNAFTAPAFSKATAPGRHSFYGEVEAAYQWRFGLQTGISYQLLLKRSASPGWQSPVTDAGGSPVGSSNPGPPPSSGSASLQDKGRLEIYLRMPLNKK